jgi:hypothetical protein
MFIEILAYEFITTGAGLLGLKALSGASINKRLAGINQPKRIRFVDSYLSRLLGPTTKTERYLARKAAKAINKISQYQASQSLMILGLRKAREHKLGKSSKDISCSLGTWW